MGDDVRSLAEGLLHQCRPFIRVPGLDPGIGPLPPAAPSYGGLGAQLSETRARLEAFELRYSGWDPVRKCIVWHTTDGSVPVARVHPQPAVVPKPPSSKAMTELRRASADRIEQLNQG